MNEELVFVNFETLFRYSKNHKFPQIPREHVEFNVIFLSRAVGHWGHFGGQVTEKVVLRTALNLIKT